GKRARDIALRLYDSGERGFDFNRYATIEQSLIVQQDQWAQARGQIAAGLIQVYRSLGGGWEIRIPVETPTMVPTERPNIRLPLPEEVPAPAKAPEMAQP